mmetsp:Transcript_120110/g.374005  ORF Transcript_120110/g.374005 Transcript_120110/m.374005 type:complete len:275 (+) Transcript_120110:468-1292(+)
MPACGAVGPVLTACAISSSFLPSVSATPATHSCIVQPSWWRCHSCFQGLMFCFSRNSFAILRSSASSLLSSTTLERMAAYSSLLLRASIRWKRVSPSSRSMARRSSESAFKTLCMSASVHTSSWHGVRVTRSAMSFDWEGCCPGRDHRTRKPISPSQLPAWPPWSTRLTCMLRPQQTATSPSRSSIRLDLGPPLCRRCFPAATSTVLQASRRERNWRRVTPELEKVRVYTRRSSGETFVPFSRSRSRRSIMLRFAMPKTVPHTTGPQSTGRRVQ